MTQLDQISNAPTDHFLIQRVAQQDQSALTEIYQRYSNQVYILAYNVLQMVELAEEITQDVFLKMWQNPGRWNASKGELIAWLTTVTRNAAIDRLRKENRRSRQKQISLDIVADTVGHAMSVNDPHWYSGQLLHSLMADLPPKQSELIELAFFQGATHVELAQSFGLPLGTVKTRIRRGLKRLRDMWEETNQSEQHAL